MVLLLERQHQREDGPSRLALELDETAVANDEVLRDGKPEAGAARATGDERIEEAPTQLRSDARAIVLHLNARRESVPAPGDHDVRERTRSQGDPPALADRLQRVARDVEQRLYELIAIEERARQARVVVALDRNGGRCFGPEQPMHVLADFVHVDQRALLRPGRTVHRIDERGQPVRFIDDYPRVFLELIARELTIEQLRRTAQAAERISDLVRELAKHHAAAVEARDQVRLARDALPLRRIGELDEQVRAGCAAGERRDGHIDGPRLARRRLRVHGELAVREPLARFERALQQGGEAVRVVEAIGEWAAARLIETEREQVLGGDIRIDRAERRVE